MSIEKDLLERSDNQCELCANPDNLSTYIVPPATQLEMDNGVVICKACKEQVENPEKTQPNHWRCLNDSMWSEHPAVQVIAWRMLTRLREEGWPADLLEMLYLDEQTLSWAKQGVELEEKIVHRDTNGAVLQQGDTVTIIKDLNVKGSSIVAKRGTAVRNINLAYNNAEQIEGKVDGQHIVILTKFVKK